MNDPLLWNLTGVLHTHTYTHIHLKSYLVLISRCLVFVWNNPSLPDTSVKRGMTDWEIAGYAHRMRSRHLKRLYWCRSLNQHRNLPNTHASLSAFGWLCLTPQPLALGFRTLGLKCATIQPQGYTNNQCGRMACAFSQWESFLGPRPSLRKEDPEQTETWLLGCRAGIDRSFCIYDTN